MKKVLVVVDYQVDFVSGALGFDAARALEPKIAQQVQTALQQGWKVVFTRDTHPADYLNTREGQFLPVPHCIEGSEGWNLYGSLMQYQVAPPQNVYLLNKPTFGCAALPDFIRGICGGEPDEVAVCGIVTNICVVSNAILLHSTLLNSKISVLADLCAAAAPTDHQNTLALLSGMGYAVKNADS